MKFREWLAGSPSWPSALSKLLVLLVCLWGRTAAADPVRVVVVTPYPQTFHTAVSAFERQFGTGRIVVDAGTSLTCAALENAAALYMHGAYWSRPMEACAATVQRLQRRGLLVGGTIPAIFQASWRVTANSELNGAAPYLRFGGADNLVGFLGALYNATTTSAKLKLTEAAPQADAGIYHHRANGPFFSLDEYLAWYRSSGLIPADAPLVGITFFQTNIAFGDLAHIDALIDAVERRGIGVVPAFGWPLKAAQPFMFRDGKPAVDLLFCLNLLMPNPENANFLAEYGIHAINLTTTTETIEQWSASRLRLPAGRIALQLATPERTGATELILIATTRKLADGSSELVPVPERIERAVARAQRWLALQTTPNRAKRVALLYFNNPPGKGMLGASYLDLFPSLENILRTLRDAGYDAGAGVPSQAQLQRLLLAAGRNVGDYAPGELDAMVRDGDVTLLPLEQYEAWYRELPADFRRVTERTWGRPGNSRLMTVRRQGRVFFVIPGIRIGNLFLGPQPLRDTLEIAGTISHDADRAQPHSYIAYYLWLRHAFATDALVHIGRHGTLEWLPGKDVVQGESDPGEVLIGELPHAYYYLVDGGGEFLQAKRRSQAVVISHLTPMLAGAGLGPEFTVIKAALDNRAQLDADDRVLREQYEQEILSEARRLRLFEALGIPAVERADADVIDRIERYVDETEEEAIPLGLHAIGDTPSADVLRDAVQQYLLASFSGAEVDDARPHVARWANALVAHDGASVVDPLFLKVRDDGERWLKGLEDSGHRELQALITVLAGRSIPTGVSGDPLRVPDAVPTGRNMHDLDPRAFPTRAAWDVGQRMATALLEQQKTKGQYPEKVSFVLWYGESNRHQGIAEAQALSLLGVEPIWNGRGQVDDVRLIPAERLGRPRVDVILTMSGLYRDGMPEKLDLLDRAVRLVAAAPDDNAVRRNAERIERELTASGIPAEDARLASRARIFGPAPQAFGVGLNTMMQSSQDDNDQARVGNRYLDTMNFAYGQGLWGRNVRGNLAAQLSNNAIVIHSRSTNLYGVLDNDETYQFAGGLNAATTLASGGRAPEFLISNVRRAGRESFEDMKTFVARELDSRTLNPKWIEGMTRAGYSGAREIAQQAENLYGVRATAPTQVDPQAWQRLLDVYVKDALNLGLPAFFEKENPFAQQMLAARLLEIDRQRVYEFTAADRQALLRTYVQSVNQFGVSCYANACANPRLQSYIVSESRRLDAVSGGELSRLEQRLRGATQRVAPAAAPSPVAAPSYDLGLSISTLLSTVTRSLPVRYGLDRSWLLVLVPLLFSPLFAWWRSRRQHYGAVSLSMKPTPRTV